MEVPVKLGYVTALFLVLVLFDVQAVDHFLYALEVAGGGGGFRGFRGCGAGPEGWGEGFLGGFPGGGVGEAALRAGGDRFERAAQGGGTDCVGGGERVGGEAVRGFELVVDGVGVGEVVGGVG